MISYAPFYRTLLEKGVTEYHLIANLEQLTYQEADIKAMKELITKMSK